MNILKFMRHALVTGMLLVAAQASAQAAKPANAAPLGMELGKTTMAEAARMVPNHQEVGINDYSHGPQWKTDGAEAGVEGIKSAHYLFDRSNVLVGVILYFPKDPKGMLKVLSGKYKLVSNKVDTFMNNGTARFEKGDSYIDINAPHLSFDMTVTYATKGLFAAFNKSVAAEKKERAQTKASKL